MAGITKVLQWKWTRLLPKRWQPGYNRVLPTSPTARDSIKKAFAAEDIGDTSERETIAIVDRVWFGFAMAVLVLVNCFTIGVETDWKDHYLGTLAAEANNLVLVLYFAEVGARCILLGGEALRDQFTLLETLSILLAFLERARGNTGFGRALPIVRLLRVGTLLTKLRILKGSRNLWVLTRTTKKGLKTLCWMTILLATMLWGCAIWMKHTLGDTDTWVGSLDPRNAVEPFESFDNAEYFGTVAGSFLTLVQIVSLSQWGDPVARRVMIEFPFMLLFFVVFVVALSYGFLTGMMANVVEDCMAASRSAEEAAGEEKAAERQRIGLRILSVLSCHNSRRDNTFSPQDLDDTLELNNTLRELLFDLNVPPLNGTSLVRLFDRNGDGFVSSEELYEGLVTLDGEITTRDFVRLELNMQGLISRAGLLSDKVQALMERVAETRRELTGAFAALEYWRNTRAETNMRNEAVKMIRRAPPPEALKLRGWKLPKEPKYPPQDDKKAFFQFVSRALGAPNGADDIIDNTEEWTRKAGNFDEDKYEVQHDRKKDILPRVSPNLLVLKELIAGD